MRLSHQLQLVRGTLMLRAGGNFAGTSEAEENLSLSQSLAILCLKFSPTLLLFV
jgi:hypothetical protein